MSFATDPLINNQNFVSVSSYWPGQPGLLVGPGGVIESIERPNPSPTEVTNCGALNDHNRVLITSSYGTMHVVAIRGQGGYYQPLPLGASWMRGSLSNLDQVPGHALKLYPGPDDMVFSQGEEIVRFVGITNTPPADLGTLRAMSDNGAAVFGSSVSPGPGYVVMPTQQPTIGLHVDGGGNDEVREVLAGGPMHMKVVGGQHLLPTVIALQAPDLQGNPGAILGALSPLMQFGSSGSCDYTLPNVPAAMLGETVFLHAFAWDIEVGLIDIPPRKVVFI